MIAGRPGSRSELAATAAGVAWAGPDARAQATALLDALAKKHPQLERFYCYDEAPQPRSDAQPTG